MLCQPIKINDSQYRCLFMVVYDNNDVELMTTLLAYISSANSNALNNILANFIEKEIYDEYSKSELKYLIPTDENAKYNSKINDLNYLFLEELEKDKYLFINAISDRPDIITLMTSMKVFDYTVYDIFPIYPKSYGEQLFSVLDNKLKLAFPDNYGIIVDIVAIYGQAEIFWSNEPDKIFNLNGNGDKITLYSRELIKENKYISQLVIKRKIDNNTKKNTRFVFYIKYHLRDPEINFDEIIYGKTTEISYQNNYFPISLFSKIDSRYNDINIGVIVYLMKVENSILLHYIYLLYLIKKKQFILLK